MDNLSAEQRTRAMRRVRSADTSPELAVRRMAHAMGYRFRLHRRDLPGAPDLVFPSRRKVVFVHGCFWHQHRCARGRRRPATRRGYWDRKLDRNRERDRQVRRRLRRDGWGVLTIWECQLKHPDRVAARLRAFLDDA